MTTAAHLADLRNVWRALKAGDDPDRDKRMAEIEADAAAINNLLAAGFDVEIIAAGRNPQ